MDIKKPRKYGGLEAASRGIEPLLKTPERPILLGFQKSKSVTECHRPDFKPIRKEFDCIVVTLFGKEKDMREDIQKIVDKLESMQYDILFWERKEENKEIAEKLADYDTCIEELIDMISCLE